jgi:hypothetical protein
MDKNSLCLKITYVVTDCVVGAILVEAEETVEHRTKSIVNAPAVHLTAFFSASTIDVVSADTNIPVCVFINL